MIRQLPILPTLFVLAAAATMVALGIWQLGRADEKADLIARFEASLENSEPVPFPENPDGLEGAAYEEAALFRQSRLNCLEVTGTTSISGKSAKGQSGLAHIATCRTDNGPAEIKLGYSRNPQTPEWQGGNVGGLIAPGGVFGVRLQMADPIAGLDSLAQPDPNDLPNNHLAYAGQWFFFALTALIIYWLAVKNRIAGRAAKHD
ncbi:MAG: SURF1 family protein [Erythrobacter sp.]